MIQPERIEPLNHKPPADKRYVLYWMQAAQRADWNHALEYAIQTANRRKKPLYVVFVATQFPSANMRHYAFMLQGLRQTAQRLQKRGLTLNLFIGQPVEILSALSRKADILITDDGYLRVQRSWRAQLAEQIDCAMVQIVTNVIVPVAVASDKENFSAGTLRPRIHRQLERFLIPMEVYQLDEKIKTLKPLEGAKTICDALDALKRLKIDDSVAESSYYRGGADEAERRLEEFIEKKLARYAIDRNDPTKDCQSNLSAYLHFGQISPLQIALQVKQRSKDGAAAFLEELIVRRELSFNFVYYNRDYDRYEKAVPLWAQRTLNVHRKDKRPYVYDLDQLENAQTTDAAWNAAQKEMIFTGKMHNYMRMYWGKKIIEWTKSPQQAFEWAIYLNDKYELDGRDPNGYAGVAWCFGKHDRAWAQRPVFGKIRYMNAAGLKRKFDIEAYIRRIESLSR